jgi:hypothetical protein
MLGTFPQKIGSYVLTWYNMHGATRKGILVMLDNNEDLEKSTKYDVEKTHTLTWKWFNSEFISHKSLTGCASNIIYLSILQCSLGVGLR